MFFNVHRILCIHILRYRKTHMLYNQIKCNIVTKNHTIISSVLLKTSKTNYLQNEAPFIASNPREHFRVYFMM